MSLKQSIVTFAEILGGVLFLLLPELAFAASASNTSDTTKSGVAEMLSIETFAMLIAAIVVFLIGLIFAWMAKNLVLRAIENSRGEYTREATKILIGRVIFVIILMIDVVVALKIIGVDFWALLAAMGLGLGFALQDILANFFAGVVILCQEKINIGDCIHVGDKSTMGTVTDITARTTIIRAFNGTEIIVPNASLISENVVCYNTNPLRRVDVALGVAYGTNIQHARKIALAAVKRSKGVEPQPAPKVIVNGFGDSSIDLTAKFWVPSRGGKTVSVKNTVIKNIDHDFNKFGIQVPFNTITLDIPKNDPETVAAMHQKNMEKIREDKIELPADNALPVSSETTPAPEAPVVENLAPEVTSTPESLATPQV